MPTHEWILIDLPPGASQLQYGAEVYRLVCSACHGDRGQGLTNQWRSTWGPADQNCWQSKCHGPNHPPDGFVMPIAPTLVGVVAMSQFATAQDLHDFIQNFMPWNNPKSLTEKDSWGVTAYILKMNGINPGTQLSPETAMQISVRPASAVPGTVLIPVASGAAPTP
jgi:cytochrome c